jgi:hypothetical protein
MVTVRHLRAGAVLVGLAAVAIAVALMPGCGSGAAPSPTSSVRPSGPVVCSVSTFLET